jgi:hypothetical protein
LSRWPKKLSGGFRLFADVQFLVATGSRRLKAVIQKAQITSTCLAPLRVTDCVMGAVWGGGRRGTSRSRVGRRAEN